MRNFLGGLVDKIAGGLKRAWAGITGQTRLAQQHLYNAAQRDRRIGELEKRFTPLRILGGHRLERTGKHRMSKRGGEIVNPAGTKLWKMHGAHTW